MKTSQKGLELIKRFEGYRELPYDDLGGHPTVGYGHKIQPGEDFSGGINKAQATELLKRDVAWAEKVVGDTVEVQLSQKRFDALVSLTYNIGASALKSSTLLEVINQGNFAYAPREFTRWVHVDQQPIMGLAKRRVAEAQLFLEGG